MYAQDAEYWDTTVALTKSVADIDGLIMARCNRTGKELVEVDGLPVLTIWWEMGGQIYSATFRCLKLREQRTTSKSNPKTKQANQMGRIAWWWMKSALLMYEYGNEEVLLPYLQIPASTLDGRKFNTTLQNQGIDWMLGNMSALPALPAPGSFFTEVGPNVD
jgi:hypothetical protein